MTNYRQLKTLLTGMAPLAVAFSGGVDSSLLLKAAHDTLGERCVAVTVDGPYHFRHELADAACLATQLGIKHLVIPLDPGTVPNLMNNPANRCYLCKKTLINHCRSALYPAPWLLVDGSTLDDQTIHRPGRRALQEMGIRSPLAEAGFTKQDVRNVSQQLGLSSWDKPAQSCLLTRFPHQTLITIERLQKVEWTETEIKKLGFCMVRVRSIGTAARLELEKGELAQAMLPNILVQLETIVKKAGFSELTIDPVGYRSGSMD